MLIAAPLRKNNCGTGGHPVPRSGRTSPVPNVEKAAVAR